jgi:hypothetical protein
MQSVLGLQFFYYNIQRVFYNHVTFIDSFGVSEWSRLNFSRCVIL